MELWVRGHFSRWELTVRAVGHFSTFIRRIWQIPARRDFKVVRPIRTKAESFSFQGVRDYFETVRWPAGWVREATARIKKIIATAAAPHDLKELQICQCSETQVGVRRRRGP